MISPSAEAENPLIIPLSTLRKESPTVFDGVMKQSEWMENLLAMSDSG
jgi:hypothetical protein